MTPGLTLYARDEPTIEMGDTLRIIPDIGESVSVLVLGIDSRSHRVTVSAPHTDLNGVRYGRDRLSEWYASGGLLINPDEEADREGVGL